MDDGGGGVNNSELHREEVKLDKKEKRKKVSLSAAVRYFTAYCVSCECRGQSPLSSSSELM